MRFAVFSFEEKYKIMQSFFAFGSRISLTLRADVRKSLILTRRAEKLNSTLEIHALFQTEIKSPENRTFYIIFFHVIFLPQREARSLRVF